MVLLVCFTILKRLFNFGENSSNEKIILILVIRIIQSCLDGIVFASGCNHFDVNFEFDQKMYCIPSAIYSVYNNLSVLEQSSSWIVSFNSLLSSFCRPRATNENAMNENWAIHKNKRNGTLHKLVLRLFVMFHLP